MDEAEFLWRHALRPEETGVAEVRGALRALTWHERRGLGDGDIRLMRLCCVQLFHVGDLRDVLTIWRARTASTATEKAIEIQLLCGAGLAATKEYLAARGDAEAAAALARLRWYEEAGDLQGFSVAARSARYHEYYRV